jgi:hypothetical protein
VKRTVVSLPDGEWIEAYRAARAIAMALHPIPQAKAEGAKQNAAWSRRLLPPPVDNRLAMLLWPSGEVSDKDQQLAIDFYKSLPAVARPTWLPTTPEEGVQWANHMLAYYGHLGGIAANVKKDNIRAMDGNRVGRTEMQWDDWIDRPSVLDYLARRSLDVDPAGGQPPEKVGSGEVTAIPESESKTPTKLRGPWTPERRAELWATYLACGRNQSATARTLGMKRQAIEKPLKEILAQMEPAPFVPSTPWAAPAQAKRRR